MLTSATVFAVIAAGVLGCVATGIALNTLTGRPGSIVYGNRGKLLWSVIFVIPLIVMASLPMPMGAAILFGIVWLILAPTVASKAYFGPKDAPWSFLFTLHTVFSLVAMVTYFTVLSIAG
jgi:hypothetical protein